MTDEARAGEPRTVAGRAFIDKLRADDLGFVKLTSGRFHLGAIVTDAEDAVLAIEREAAAAVAAPPLDEALTLLKMAAPRSAIGGAAFDAWLFEVRAFLKENVARLSQPSPDASGESR